MLAFLGRPGGAGPGRASSGPRVARPAARLRVGPVVLVVLAGLGVAAAFAPAWDSFTLRTAAGQVQSVTAGNAFSNPGLVIAGDVVVMIVLAAVVVVAALWCPVRHGAMLLAGANIPMAAQAISALVKVSQAAPASPFGISNGQGLDRSGSRSAPVSRRRSGSSADSSSCWPSPACGCSSRRSLPR